MQKNGPSPSGCGLKSTLAALQCLKIAPLFPAHGAWLSPLLGRNTTTNNFETASSSCTVSIAGGLSLKSVTRCNADKNDGPIPIVIHESLKAISGVSIADQELLIDRHTGADN